MLCQLVCLDRRYQRMNCFNIREVQALLKGRFFNDLVNSHDHHEFLNKTVIGLRFKTNNLDSIQPSTLLFYQFGVYSNLNTRSQSYTSSYSTTNNYVFFENNSFFSSLVSFFDNHLSSNFMNFFYNPYLTLLNSLTLGTPAFNSNVSGKSTFFSFIHTITNFSKTELDRVICNVFNLLNLNQPM